MSLSIRWTNKFKKDYTRCISRGLDINLLNDAIKMLSETHAGTNFMHESFNKDDASDFSRSWFAWANALFAQMLGTL